MNGLISFGDYGSDVLQLQRNLNRFGFPIKEDGFFGNVKKPDEDETGDALEMWQREHGLKPDRKYGPLSDAVMQRELGKITGTPYSDISVKAFQLLLDYEVGGGETYYNKFLKCPTWPGGASGVTIGIGYDLGYEGTAEPFRNAVSVRNLERLNGVLGAKGNVVQVLVRELKDIVIPWKYAVKVFEDYTIPRELAKTQQAFPGLWKLPLDVQGALVSLVYNRGTSMSGDSRREMREIREAVWKQDVPAIADALESMKRLWVGKGLQGLLDRRDAEARLVREAIA